MSGPLLATPEGGTDGQVPDQAHAVPGARAVHRVPAHVPHLREAAGRRPGAPSGRAVTTPEQIAAAREAFGLDKPLYVQYGRFAKGLVPWPGLFLTEDVYYSYGNFVAVKEEIYRRLPVTITLAVGAAVIWLAMGVPIGIISAVRKGSVVGPRRHGVRADRRVDAGVLARPAAPVLLLVPTRVGALVRPRDRRFDLAIDREGQVHPALDHPGVHVGGVLRAHGARQPDRDDERGLHPHGSRQGPRRATRRLQARSARSADARRDDARPRHRVVARRRVHHRDAVRTAGRRSVRGRRRSVRTTSQRSWESRCSAQSSSPSRTSWSTSCTRSSIRE